MANAPDSTADENDSEEKRNLVASLKFNPNIAGNIFECRQSNTNKAEFTRMAACFGNLSFAEEIAIDLENPSLRTVFIHKLSDWVESIAAINEILKVGQSSSNDLK